MCELFGVSARFPTHITLSLTEFARHGGLTAPHRDGWGVSYYHEEDAHLIREADAAADSDWVRFIREHQCRSKFFLSHIRRATTGGVALKNTHPFTRELGGRAHTFAHNGRLTGYLQQGRWALGRFRPIGRTDSEYAFCVLLDRMRPLWDHDKAPSLAERFDVIHQFAEEARQLGPFNFLYCDSEYLFVHAHRRRAEGASAYTPPGLHVIERACALRGDDFVEGVDLNDEEARQEAVLVASVPLSDEAWQPMAEGELIALAGGRIYRPDEGDR